MVGSQLLKCVVCEQVVGFLSSIPNLEYDILEELVRDHQIDGESMLLLTQVSGNNNE